MKTLNTILIAIPFIVLSSNALACDDKSCEKAYLQSTSQYVANDRRHAVTAKTEREAYAKNRERRDYAVVSHLQRLNTYLSHQ